MSSRLFRGLRLEIAIVLNGQQRTLYETAKALGLRSGDIQKVLRQMHDDGLLLASDPNPVRGTLFWLNPERQDELIAALRGGDGALGVLKENQDLLLVKSSTRTALDEVIGRDDLAVTIAWAARLGGGAEMLLAIALDAPEREFGRLWRMLEDTDGIEVSQLHTAKVLDAAALRSNVRAAQEVEESNPV
jgi:hypothetical protein